jgi:hypothetical protein
MTEDRKRADERYIKRGCLYDFELTRKHKIFENKNIYIKIQLISMFKWDLTLEINVIKKRSDGMNVYKHSISIPISPYAIWVYIRNKRNPVVTWKNV